MVESISMSDETHNEAEISPPDPFASLEVPANIDPRLLELWFHREREALEKGGTPQKKNISGTRKLTWLFASCTGILVMCMVIVLGLIQGNETDEILKQTCQSFLFYGIAGFFAGWIMECCVIDSVETLLREAVRRSSEAAARKSDETELGIGLAAGEAPVG